MRRAGSGESREAMRRLRRTGRGRMLVYREGRGAGDRQRRLSDPGERSEDERLVVDGE